jgi:translocation and assembly module TamB
MAPSFDLAALLASSTAPASAPLTSSPYLRNLQFEIQADSAPDARLEWNGSRFEADANMRVRGTWENPILLGHIALRNGEINFAGNKYKVTRGDIDFTNPFRIDPVLNIQATATVSQYEVTLDLTGPASRLSLSYRSDPPLPTSDIISLLALGQPTESTQYMGSGSNSQMGATALLSEAITSQLGGRMEKIFGISSFRLDPFLAGTGTQQNAATRVTVEQQVRHNLSVTYSSNVTGSQEQVIQIEYEVTPELSIIALRDINGIFSLDVVRKKRFK